jgi:arylsulfatase A-like enzyme
MILVDDLNDWVLHPEDHPEVKTPNLDRLRRRSVTFTNAHAVVPVCGPSRRSLLVGLYPQTTGDYGPNWRPWHTIEAFKGAKPIPQHCLDHGYRVLGDGKIFHVGKSGDFWTEFGPRGSDYGPWPWRGKGQVKNTPHPNHYELWKDYLEERQHRDLDYAPLSDVPVWKSSDGDFPGAKGWYHESGEPFQYVSAENRDRLPDEYYADWAIERIRQDHDRPFFLTIGFIRPHTPLYAPDEFFERYPLEDVKLPPYKENDREDCATPLTNRWLWGVEKFNTVMKSSGFHGLREWVRAYSASTSFVDAQIGRVLDALNNSAHSRDTIVILASDHGYHVGEKDVIQKWHLWDESTRVPLIIHVPGNPANGKENSHPVSLIDIYPTLIDLCRLRPDPHLDYPLGGHSLRPLIPNPTVPIRKTEWTGPDVAFMAVRGEGGFEGQEGALPHFSVRSGHYRYTRCANGEEELYDHRSDPHEWRNLAGSEAYREIRTDLQKSMDAILDETRSDRARE